MSIKCGNCKQHHDSAFEVKRCYSIAEDPAASPSQLSFAHMLFREREPFGEWADLPQVEAEKKINTLRRQDASYFISRMKGAEFRKRLKVDEGIYYGADGEVYKVQRSLHNNGKTVYCKKWEWSDEDKHEGGFVYLKGGLRALGNATKMSTAEMQQWGKLYGYCCVCGRRLTDEKSISAGIGPVCLRKESAA
jgi:hypothetical protein